MVNRRDPNEANMAAAIGSRLGCTFSALSKNVKPQQICQTFRVSANETLLYQTRPHHRFLHTRTRANSRVKYAVGGVCGLTFGVTLAGYIVHRAKQLRPTVLADENKTTRPPPAPRRSVCIATFQTYNIVRDINLFAQGHLKV